MSDSTDKPIILYHYQGSPYAARVVACLALKGIPYKECVSLTLNIHLFIMLARLTPLSKIQPVTMPRPDLAALGIHHRRIPILSIGRDVYLDSRLIIDKLTQLRPTPSSSADLHSLETLVKMWTTHTGELFSAGGMLVPADNTIFNEAQFQRDRADLVGGDSLKPESRAAGRPEAILTMRRAFEFVENTLLADGREWVLGTEAGPGMADLEAGWPMRWMAAFPGALDNTGINEETFPRTYAWIDRFNKALQEAQKQLGKPETVSGKQAADLITSAEGVDAKDVGLDEKDPIVQARGLKKGQTVLLWPSDYGSAHKDQGELVSVNGNEVVIETQAVNGGKVLVHAPRLGFRIAPHAAKM